MLAPIKDNIPDVLRAIPQWVCWLAVRRDNGKIAKVPVSAVQNCQGLPAAVDKPATWAPFETAWTYYEKNQGHTFKIANKSGALSGLGLVLTRELGLIGVDIDAVFAGGELKLWARDLVTTAQTYCEFSPSGQGLRLFVKGTLPWDGKRSGNLELYTAGHFLTVTGHLFDQGFSDVA